MKALISEKNASAMMQVRPALGWIALIIATIALNTLVTFYVIPKAHNSFHQLYNQDEYADGYDQLATNLVNGNGYRFFPDTARTLMREPGYPVVLAGIFYLFGVSLVAVKAVNVCLALTTAYIISVLARIVLEKRLLTIGAPIIFLFHPGTLIGESRGASETLFTFLLTLFVFTLYRALRSDKYSSYVISGIVLGLAVLVRSTPILLPIVLLAYLFVYHRQGRRATRNITYAGVLVVVMSVVISPWVIRNFALTGKLVPTASVVGVSAQTGLYISTHHSSDSHRVDREAAEERNQLAYELGLPFKSGYYQYFYASGDELKFSDFLLKRVMHEYAMHPTLFLRIASLNLFNFWCGGKAAGSIVLNAIIQFPYVVFAIIGIVASVGQRRFYVIAPLVLLITYIAAISVPILAQARYSVPIIPFLAILASYGVASVRDRFQVTPQLRAGHRPTA